MERKKRQLNTSVSKVDEMIVPIAFGKNKNGDRDK